MNEEYEAGFNDALLLVWGSIETSWDEVYASFPDLENACDPLKTNLIRVKKHIKFLNKLKEKHETRCTKN